MGCLGQDPIPKHFILISIAMDKQIYSIKLRSSSRFLEPALITYSDVFLLSFFMDKQQLQEELAEHQVPIEKLQKVARDLMEIEGEPAPDHKHVQETIGMKQQYTKSAPLVPSVCLLL